MSKVDISSEAVERLATTCQKRGYVSPPRNPEDYAANFSCMEALSIAATLRAQAARIAKLEAENAILRTEKHADAEAIAAMKEAGMDRLVAEGQRCDAMTPQEAAKVSAEDRENIVDEIESIICETHEMDVRDIDYAENIVSWLERHHPAALRAISEDSQ
ncbi:MAG: hypothetical protein KBT76_15365 [Sulfitobacter litoralis]|nr:hypothetical protein [Sulfitobacter litoralis]